MGENDVASSGIYQSTNHHGNMDGNYNDDSQSYDTPQRGKYCYSSFGDTITTTITSQYSTLSPPGELYLCFHIEGGSAHAAQCAKSRELIKVLKAKF